MAVNKRGGLKSYEVLDAYIKHLENHVTIIDQKIWEIKKYHDEVEDAHSWNDVHHTAFGGLIDDIVGQLKEASQAIEIDGVENLKKLRGLYNGIGLKQ